MQIKTAQPMYALCFETETTMQEMFQYVRVVARRIYQEAIKNDLEVTGPVYWIYKGADGQTDTKFSLTIAVPVSKTDAVLTESEFSLKTIGSFDYISQTHFGDWMKLGETYGQLIGEIHAKGLTMSGENREIYLNMDFENPEGNITEVQIGISRN